MIQDNAASRGIIEFLAGRGHADINDVNISDWVHGDRRGSSGYNDWLREREQLTAMQARQEFARELVSRGEGHHLHEATRLMAAAHLSEVILGFNLRKLKQNLGARPEAYAILVSALRRLSHDHLAYEKYRHLVAEEKEKIQAELGETIDRGLRPETIARIREILDRI